MTKSDLGGAHVIQNGPTCAYGSKSPHSPVLFSSPFRSEAAGRRSLLVRSLKSPRTFAIEEIQAFSATIASFKFLRDFCNMKEDGIDISSGSSVTPEEKLPVLPPITAKSGPVCLSSKVQATPEIEKKYVHHVYDAIAPHFSSTRFAKWPKVQGFLNSLPTGSLILDAGCGNGKYLGLNPNCYFVGCDISSALISICADKGHEVLVADAVNLPYRTGYGDASISIAVLHHLSTESRRKKAVEELIRVVKTGGLVLITVWAREQEDKSLVNKWTPLTQKYLEEWIGPGSPRIRSPSSISLESIPEMEENSSEEQSKEGSATRNGDDPLDESRSEEGIRKNQQEYFVPWHLPYHRAEISGASADAVASGFARKDDKKGAVVYDRYYHVFSEGELERLVSGMDGAVIVDKFYDKSNWCVILEKTS
ncbi:tRNA (carboxymethyluridine(34)-5-O)-methyltransferase isoform X2 [Andrographis paniculata]|uniref:tRNA (carboxymethyluridine(34)-5-O)-methyltransferase isoform X2 n=1 Tax=Andrographis paniculata TaxID=175694 RepID=UPI0021E87592|nr:tRNA (carboxymethyluridine(34)-5-O)-methyltransferase isoform X2 [Andrographis paniculata]